MTSTLEGAGWDMGVLHMTEAIAETGMKEVEIYATQRQNTVAQYIEIRTVIGLCLAAG